MPVHGEPEAVVGIQSAPEFAEMYTKPKGNAAAASLTPSAEEHTQAQFVAGAVAGVQVAPEFVER